MIYTKFHELHLGSIAPSLVAKMHKAAKYHIELDVVDLLHREDAMLSIKALVEAGICKLPFSPILMEYSVQEEWRRFILLEEKENSSGFRGDSWMIHKNGLQYENSIGAMAFLEAQGFVCSNVINKQDAHAIIAALCMAMLFLNVDGIEKRVIVPDAKLMKARRKLNKSEIPTVTTLRIGTVYDRDGRPVKMNGLGSKQRVHMRAGHTRRQHYGKGNEFTKIIYVPPVLVNYKSGDQLPDLPTKRIKM